MNALDAFETVANWLIAVSAAILLGVIVVSWLASYRQPKAAPIRSGDWFFVLPVWAQITAGFAACLLFTYLGYLFWIPLPLTVSPMTSWIVRVVGLALFLPGWLLVMWARWALGSMYGVSTSFVAPLQARHQLIQHGPYAFVRHPMYLGYWLVLAGVTLIYLTWTPLVILLVCLASFYRRAQREEAALAAAFGAEWQAYQMRTKFLIPFMY